MRNQQAALSLTLSCLLLCKVEQQLPALVVFLAIVAAFLLPLPFPCEGVPVCNGPSQGANQLHSECVSK